MHEQGPKKQKKEDHNNDQNIRRAHERHAGGGRETIIQFVVALICKDKMFNFSSFRNLISL